MHGGESRRRDTAASDRAAVRHHGNAQGGVCFLWVDFFLFFTLFFPSFFFLFFLFFFFFLLFLSPSFFSLTILLLLFYYYNYYLLSLFSSLTTGNQLFFPLPSSCSSLFLFFRFLVFIFRVSSP